MDVQKHYSVRMYDREGVYVRTLKPQDIENYPPRFTSVINGGFGEHVIELRGDDWKFNDFGEGDVIDFNNYIEIYAVKLEDGVQSETLIYGGFLSRYEAYIEGSQEGIRLTFLGWVSLLSKAYYMNGASYTVTHTGDDPGTIISDVITHINTVFGGSHIGVGDVDLVGTTVDAEYEDKKHLSVITDAALLAPAGWWWHVDASGDVYFKAKPVSADHRFTVGRDVINLSVVKDGENIVNDTQVRYTGAATYEADDATSQETFGLGSPTPSWNHSSII